MKPITSHNFHSRNQNSTEYPEHLKLVEQSATADIDQEKEQQQIDEYLKHSHAESTLKSYEADWKEFQAYCSNHSHQPLSLPAEVETILSFLHLQAQKNKPATIVRKLSAIRYFHLNADLKTIPTDHPKVKQMMSAIRNELGVRPEQKKPLTIQRLNAIINIVPDTLKGCRDKAILRIGFAGAFRRSELVALQMNDIELSEEGVKIIVRKSKTDQQGAGMIKTIPKNAIPLNCPVAALERWLAKSGITEGPVFRRMHKGEKVGSTAMTGRSIAKLVKEYVKQAGFDESEFSGHSLRSGFVTSAAKSNSTMNQIMMVTGHANVQTVLGYIREADGFRNYPKLEE